MAKLYCGWVLSGVSPIVGIVEQPAGQQRQIGEQKEDADAAGCVLGVVAGDGGLEVDHIPTRAHVHTVEVVKGGGADLRITEQQQHQPCAQIVTRMKVSESS